MLEGKRFEVPLSVFTRVLGAYFGVSLAVPVFAGLALRVGLLSPSNLLPDDAYNAVFTLHGIGVLSTTAALLPMLLLTRPPQDRPVLVPLWKCVVLGASLVPCFPAFALLALVFFEHSKALGDVTQYALVQAQTFVAITGGIAARRPRSASHQSTVGCISGARVR